MPATMVAFMPTKEYIANCKWFTQAECDVYGQEYSASGWTGALHNYRHRRTAFAANIAEQLTFSGRTIDVPAQFIAGKQDWGANRIAGGAEGAGKTGYTKFSGVQLVDRAGHWPHEEQPQIVSRAADRLPEIYVSHAEEGRAMVDLTRRSVIAAGAAAAATAAMPGVFAQQSGKTGTGKFYERGPVRIYYEEAGSGFPLLLLPGGGLNSTIGFFTGNSPFNAIEEFKGQYRCITADLRNAPGGQSTGPVEVDRPWESYADDHLGLMDHLKIDKFMVMGFCIGGPFIGSLLKRAPNRIAAAVMAQPVGWRPEMRDPKYPGTFWKSWGPALIAKRPEITTQTTDQFMTRMFETNPDFLFTVTRDFIRSCQNPILVLPDDVPAHPLAVAMECAMLAPKSEVSIFPWKEPKERIPLAVRQIHSFLKAHRPA